MTFRASLTSDEPLSLLSAPDEVKKFWTIGHAIAPLAFVGKSSPYPISDDQTALSEVGIPSFLVIDFDFEPDRLDAVFWWRARR